MSKDGTKPAKGDVNRDIYGFRLTCGPEELETRRACEQKQAQQWANWEKYWKRKQLPKPEKLKKLCRKGIPLELRPWVWTEVSGAAARKQEQVAGYYDAMLQRGQVSSECAHQIELDLPRTFPQNSWMALEEGQVALGRVLLAFSVHKPTIGYCQGMNYIAALLLVIMERNEEDAFWLLVSLIDDGGILYHDMYTHNLVGTHVEMQSLEALVAKKVPKLQKHLKKLTCDMTIIATDWFLCLFCTVLPSETAARIWDALLEEGAKILYRVGIALLKLFEGQLLATDNAGDLINRLRQCTQQLHDRDRLMKEAFNHTGSMPMQRIKDVREAKQESVDIRMKEREDREQLRRSLSIPRATNTKAAPTNGLAGFAERLNLKNASWSGRNTSSSASSEPLAAAVSSNEAVTEPVPAKV